MASATEAHCIKNPADNRAEGGFCTKGRRGGWRVSTKGWWEHLL